MYIYEFVCHIRGSIQDFGNTQTLDCRMHGKQDSVLNGGRSTTRSLFEGYIGDKSLFFGGGCMEEMMIYFIEG